MIKFISILKLFLLKKMPAIVVVPFSMILSVAYYYYSKLNMPQAIPMVQNAATPTNSTQKLKYINLDGFSLTHPVLMVDIPSESENLAGLKSKIETKLNELSTNGTITDASVYLRIQTTGEWLNINPHKTFSPGSLIKVPLLITYLKLSEQNKSWLTKEIPFIRPGVKVPSQTFTSHQIVYGEKYTVKELLRYATVYSDNNATLLLNENMDVGAFEKLFTDLGLNKPNIHDPAFVITASEYSRFFRILYNSSYLTPENSQFALDLLAESDYTEGITKAIPPNIKVAHKFGEHGNKTLHQLHETGIVFYGNTPYVITVMSKGKDIKKLPEVLSGISSIVFNELGSMK